MTIDGYTTTRKYRELQLKVYDGCNDGLYHYEKIQGTTTKRDADTDCTVLYHYEKIQGTTTFGKCDSEFVGYTTTRKYRELLSLSTI